MGWTLRLVPAVLSFWLLAAHFLRAGDSMLVAATLALPGVLAFRRFWALRLVQIGLGLAALEWVRTGWVIAQVRRTAGEPWARMAVILGVVALLALLGAALLQAPGTRQRLIRPKRSGSSPSAGESGPPASG